MPIGPRGEKRPNSSVASMTMALKIATGQMEEQYVDGQPWTDEQVMARQIARSQPTAKKKKRKKAKQV